MSVLITGMEMPMNCCRCPCADLEYYDCNLMPGTGISSDRKSGKRRDDCPLVPVPPHGALMDRDAYRDEFMSGVYDLCDDDPDNCRANAIIDLFDSAPTVILADPPKEET